MVKILVKNPLLLLFLGIVVIILLMHFSKYGKTELTAEQQCYRLEEMEKNSCLYRLYADQKADAAREREYWTQIEYGLEMQLRSLNALNNGLRAKKEQAAL